MACITRACNHGDRQHSGDLIPMPPAVKMAKIICADQPDEFPALNARQKCAERIIAIACAQLHFEITYPHARMFGHAACAGKASLKRILIRLKRIARCRYPPDPVQLQSLHGSQSDMTMSGMCRIERAAEQANAKAFIGSGQAQGHGFCFSLSTSTMSSRWITAGRAG